MLKKSSKYEAFAYLSGVKVYGKATVLEVEYRPKVGTVALLELTPKLSRALCFQTKKELVIRVGDRLYRGDVIYQSGKQVSVASWKLHSERREFIRVEIPFFEQVGELHVGEKTYPCRVVDVSEMGAGVKLRKKLQLKAGEKVGLLWNNLKMSAEVVGVRAEDREMRLSLRFERVSSPKALSSYIVSRQKDVASLLS
jgi:hypothetical protein